MTLIAFHSNVIIFIYQYLQFTFIFNKIIIVIILITQNHYLIISIPLLIITNLNTTLINLLIILTNSPNQILIHFLIKLDQIIFLLNLDRTTFNFQNLKLHVVFRKTRLF